MVCNVPNEGAAELDADVGVVVVFLGPGRMLVGFLHSCVPEAAETPPWFAPSQKLLKAPS